MAKGDIAGPLGALEFVRTNTEILILLPCNGGQLDQKTHADGLYKVYLIIHTLMLSVI